MVSEQIAELIAAELPFTLNEEQREAALRLGAFIADPRNERCFALRGYAGTGKTSLVGALVRVLKKAEISVVLLAPRGVQPKYFPTMPVLLPTPSTASSTVRKPSRGRTHPSNWPSTSRSTPCISWTRLP